MMGDASEERGLGSFFLPADYVENVAPNTREWGEPGTYWNEERIRLNASSRLHVYRLASRLLVHCRSRRYLDIGSGPSLKVRDWIVPLTNDITLLDQPSVASLALRHVPTATFIGLDLESESFRQTHPYDFIMSSDVVEHLLDPTNYMTIIRENLALDGLAVITTPEREYLYGRGYSRSGNRCHVREWDRGEFRRFVEHSGLIVRRQIFYPMLPIPVYEFALSRLATPFVRTRRWSSCQVLICAHP
jgi:hypothetical protein